MPKSKLGQMFIDARLIDEHQLASALAEQRSWGGRLGDILITKGWVEPKDVLRLLSDQLSMPVIRLEDKEVEAETLELITAQEAEKHCCLPLFVREEGQREVLYLAMDDPTNLEAIDNLSFRTGLEIHPVLASTQELISAREKHYSSNAVSESSSVEPEVPFEPPIEQGTDVFTEAFNTFELTPEPSPEPTIEPTPEPTPPTQDALESQAMEKGVAAESSNKAASSASDFMKFSQNSFNLTSPHLITQALAGLLLEKGLISVEELTQRIEDLWVRELEDNA
jgi:type IV pilus assembly protein PilB